ncbi:MAG: hypothetical protein ACLP0J_22055 [Solirubrobacteraceae bacterium]
MKNRTCSMVSWALRPGRNPYEIGQKSASKIGSSRHTATSSALAATHRGDHGDPPAVP